MKFIFHGGASQVGRSCIELQTQEESYLLDCGIRFLTSGFEFPEGIDCVKCVNAVFLSHAHLDHSGALPYYEHLKLTCPIFMTAQTKAITRILLKDSYKIARIKHLHAAYTADDLQHVRAATKTVEMEKRYHFGKVHFTYYNAGHIPGSASIEIECEDKKVVYSGDYNTRSSNLMIGANPQQYAGADVFITEATYGARELPERGKLGDKFLDTVAAYVKKGGKVLIPAFAVGRSQDVLIALSKRKWDVPIYFDGMCKQVTRKIIMNPSRFIQNKEALQDMYFNVVQFVNSENMRNDIAQKSGIFVCTSGMLQGGPAIHYLKHFWHEENSCVLLTGYQVHNTNGWLLDNEGEVYIDGTKTKVKCYVERFDFSAHLGQEELHKAILTVEPKHLIINHGDDDAIEALATWAKENSSAKVYTPAVGDEIVIK